MKASEGGTRSVAKQKRKPAAKPPITASPLFPAVVALWFGALFGLGSLAVRPSLIEDLVLSSRIDLVIPAAAPPLGMTARIMLALLLAVLGAVIGVLLARRLSRPKQEVRERARSVGGKSADAEPRGARSSYRNAPSCQPISMQEIDPDANLGLADSGAGARRRGLTAEHVEDEFVPHDFAPLPGGETPHVLDLAKVAPPMMAPLPPAEVAPADVPVAATSPAFAAPVQPAAAPAERQMFQPEPATSTEFSTAPLAPETAAAHADGRQVFGMEQQQPQPERPRQIFGQAVEGDHVTQDFVRDAGYRTTVFEQEAAAPLFQREDAAAPVAAPAAIADPAPIAEPAPFTAPAAPLPEAFQPLPPAAPTPQPQAFEPLPEASVAEAPVAESVAEPAALIAAAPVAAAPGPLPSPAGLPMTDLASRLAESMRRRRAARNGTPLEAAAPVAAEPTIAMPEPVAAEPVAAAPVLQGFEPAAPAFAPAAEAAPIPQAIVPPAPVVEPIAAAAPVPAAFSAPPAQSAAIPSAYEPAPEPAPQVVAPAPALPNALRPLALDAFLEEDSQFDSSLLPPRHIVMTAPAPQVAASEPPAAFAAPAAAESLGEEPVAEDNYASLLGIGQARTGFVRIEEAEPDLSAPEPVVIFPGQGPLAQAAPAPAAFAAADPAAPSDSAALRRFDSPAAANFGQAIDVGSAPASVPATEAEQALRSALASLQRISGAA